MSRSGDSEYKQRKICIAKRTNVMLGFNRFRNATITLAGIELTHRIRKGQFNLAKLGLKDTAA
ncbi:transposase-like protein [Paraburkholderia sp. 35.1]